MSSETSTHEAGPESGGGSTAATSGPGPLTQPLRLPCGQTLPNRIAKAAMTERMAHYDGCPTPELTELYRRWAIGGSGLIITGNVMVDGSALETARNMVVEDDRHIGALRELARTTAGTEAKLIAQLSHPGRQTRRGASIRGRKHQTVAPSPIGLGLNPVVFADPRELTDAEIVELIGRYAETAAVMAEAGFDGVQLHSAHGYLFAQFLSPLSNQRTDRWGGSLENRARFLLESLRAVREATPSDFIVAAKLNSADFQRGGFDPDDSLEVALALEADGCDLVEISGGTYQSTAMSSGDTSAISGSPSSPDNPGNQSAAPKRESTRRREAFFIEFAERFATELEMPLMLTGGFRTLEAMTDAVANGGIDVIGLGRPLAQDPDLAKGLLDGSATESPIDRHVIGIKMLDDELDTSWYQQQLVRIGAGEEPDPNRGNARSVATWLATSIRDNVRTGLPARR